MTLSVGLITTWRVRCGIASYSANLAKALASLGVEAYIIRMPRFGGKTPELLEHVVHKIPVNDIDVIHCEHEYGIWGGFEGGFYAGLKRLGKPVVTTMHSAGMFQLDRIVSENSDRVIVHNEFCARRFGYPCVVIPHGCRGPFHPPPIDVCKKAIGIDPRAPIVGYVGFISSVKGLEFLISAMTKVPKAGLVVGGGWHVTGAETQYIADMKQNSLKALPGRCQWLGYVPDEKLIDIYGAMDIVVYPSRFMTESGALLMALSHGKAVIASDLRPVREKRKQGALTTFKTVPGLTRKIKQLLKDDDLRAKLEQGATEYAEKNSWSNVAKLHLSLYEDVLEKFPKPVSKGEEAKPTYIA